MSALGTYEEDSPFALPSKGRAISMTDSTCYRGETMSGFCCVIAIITVVISVNAVTASASPMQMAVTGTTIDPGFGTLHHAVSTRSEQAQKFFDQGLKLNYALNHEAAVQSYRRALELDSDLAMAYWGIAHAMGPDINQPMTSSTSPWQTRR